MRVGGCSIDIDLRIDLCGRTRQSAGLLMAAARRGRWLLDDMSSVLVQLSRYLSNLLQARLS